MAPCLLVVALLTWLGATLPQHVAAQPTAVLDNTTMLTDIDPDSDVVECEIELTYSANAINMPKFDATFVLRNNRAKQLSAWQVVWRYESEKLVPGSVEGAILLATGSPNGPAARVVNTRNNVPILPYSTKGFTFTAFSTLDEEERRNASRAPSSVSVNGLSCAQILSEEDQERRLSQDSLDLDRVETCVPPAETNNSVLFLPTCLSTYCCGLLSSPKTDSELQKKEARRSLLPSEIILEEDDVAFSDCSSMATVVLAQNVTTETKDYVRGGDVIFASMVDPGGYFGLCANTSVGPLFGEDYFDFYMLANKEQAISLSVVLGVSVEGEQTELQELVEAELPLYAITNINQAGVWMHVVLDLQALNVPGWSFFGIKNNEEKSQIPLLVYDMGLYSSVDREVAQAQPPQVNWALLEQDSNLTAVTSGLRFASEKEQTSKAAILPALIFSMSAVLVVMVVSMVMSCVVRKRLQQQNEKRKPRDTADQNIFSRLDIMGLKEAIIRRYENVAGVKILDEAPADGIFDINFKTDVELKEIIGSGGFGTVHKAKWGGEMVAVKIMHGLIEGSQMLETFKKEIFLLSRLKHPGIVNFLGASLQPPDICIVQELAEGGSLFTLLHGSGSENNPLRYIDILRYGVDLADAMAYLHPEVIHRDLKSQNVLLGADKRAKVCDFGIAKFKDKTLLTTVNSQAGTPSYMAPELFSAGAVTEKCDVFSYGVLLWECFTGCVPWDELTTPMQVIFAVGVQKQRLPVPPHCPTFLAKLMADCWRDDPSDRPSFSIILNWIEEEYERYIAQKSLQMANGEDS
jgi:hypothetical protein